MTNSRYIPKPGSKVAKAADAMGTGPKTTAELAKVMECEPASVNATLMLALEHGYMIKVKDEKKVIHFALGGSIIDERFTPHGGGGVGDSRNARGRVLTDAPLVRRVSAPVKPSDDAIAHANLFRRNGASGGGEDVASITEHTDISQAPAVPVFTKGHQVATEALDSARSEALSIAEELVEQDPEFACAFWSDGELTMVRDGETVAILSPSELRKVREFLGKVSAP